MKRGLSERSVSGLLFSELLDSLETMDTIAFHPTGVALACGSVDGYLERQRRKVDTRRRQALRNLERQELILLRARGNKLLFALTEKGKKEAIRWVILNGNRMLPRGRFCYVSFDIPHGLSDVRSTLRHLFKRAHFMMVHQSLWATSRDVVAELVSLVESMDAGDWIHVFVGEPRSRLPMGNRSARMNRHKK
jgi:hypothetical protein